MASKKFTLSQQTADQLKDLILKQKVYHFGEKLPNENVLSVQLGISRTTLREAIRVLVSEGLLDVRRGKGTFVSEQLNQYVDSSMKFEAFSDRKVTLRDLYEARMIIEPAAAALACQRATDEEIKEILSLGAACQACVLKDPTGNDRISSESAFHTAILRASHNDFLSRFSPILTETIAQTFAMNYHLEGIAEDAYKDHIMIMNFLEQRDAEALRSAVTIHLHHALWNEEISLS